MILLYFLQMFQNRFPGKMNITAQGESWTDGKSQDVSVSNFGGSDVDLSLIIDALAESLIDIIAANESKTDQAKTSRNW